ncbi:hypothetical protein BMF94_0745 [Rhodotorula taiwanensis]|uniref:Uncharacterized protein n=1 Tax=Rhodotorula taiwanensis TaxID=741276 RepID=A0A2S5BGX5_9BASI|nr:hypothetical protein BMF94_0745 [Rhodotorula taiwanensis]
MSATYVLSDVGQPAPKSTTLPAVSNGAPASPAGEVGHSDSIWCAKWARKAGGGEIVATAGADHSIKLWDPQTPTAPVRTIRPRKALGVVGLDFDKSEQGATFLVSSTLDSVITRWSVDGEEEGRKELGPAVSWDVSLHPRLEQMATAGDKGKVTIMSSAKDNFGEVLATLEATGTFGTAVEYASPTLALRDPRSKGGNLLAVASDKGYVSLFDVESRTLVTSFPAHTAPIRSITFTSNLLITGSDDKRINVFDLRALTSSSSGHGHDGASQNGLGGGRRGQVASLGGHEGWVVKVEARNDRLLASGSSDGTIKLWDLSAPSLALATLRDHTADVWAIAFAPEPLTGNVIEGLGGAAAGLGGARMCSAGEDGRLRWWRGGG